MNEKKQNDVRSKLLNAVLQKPYTFEVSDKNNKKRKFTLKPPCLNCLLAVSEIFSNIDLKEIFNDKIDTLILVKKYCLKMAKAATLILNNSDVLDNELLNYLLDNLTAKELHEVFTEAVFRVGIADFRKSIIVSQTMSLMNEREMIALSQKKIAQMEKTSSIHGN